MTPFFDPVVSKWVALRLFGPDGGFGQSVAMGVEHGSQIVAGVVFHDWDPEAGTIEVSSAATDPRWCTRTVIRRAMAYAFEECGVQAILIRTAWSNRRARKIWLALGADEHRIPRMYGRHEDGAVLVLTDDAWAKSKFNEVTHG